MARVRGRRGTPPRGQLLRYALRVSRFALCVSLADGQPGDYRSAAMTRKSIEACAKVFIVALSLVFAWALWRALGMMGVL